MARAPYVGDYELKLCPTRSWPFHRSHAFQRGPHSPLHHERGRRACATWVVDWKLPFWISPPNAVAYWCRGALFFFFFFFLLSSDQFETAASGKCSALRQGHSIIESSGPRMRANSDTRNDARGSRALADPSRCSAES